MNPSRRAPSHRYARAATLGLAAVLTLMPMTVRAQAAADTTLRVTFGGFIDGYYAWDSGRPPTRDRSFAGGATFTTQPARHNEFNLNLAYIEAVLAAPRVRGRLALQAGTAVQSNYAAEPANGTVSGSSLSRILQEAFAGYRITPAIWVDGGIFYSHIGLESWASKDNPTYTRSLVADYSPYYASGVRAVWQATPSLAVRVDLVNGWQNISETNDDKGGGLRLDWTATSSTTLTYYGFVNGETGGRLRLLNGVGARFLAGATTLLGQFDLGSLERAGDTDGRSSWYGFTLVARRQVTPALSLNGRVERYDDEDQVNIATGLPQPFRANGASVGIDVSPGRGLLWRTELRGFLADQAIFDDGGDAARQRGGFVVTSLSLAF